MKRRFSHASGRRRKRRVYGDIHERTLVDEQVLSIAEFYRENPHPVLRLGRNGEVLSANDRAASLMAEELRGKRELLPRDLLAAAKEALRTGEAREAQIECAAGRMFSFVCAPVPERGYVNLYGRDVTERVRTEKALHESNRRLRLLSELAEHLLTAEVPVDAASAAFRMIAKELDLHAYFNYLLEPDGSLRLDSWSGIPRDVADRISRLKLGEAVCGLVAQTRQPIHATHIQSSDESRVEFIRSFGLRAYYSHPLLVKNRLLGTLSFGTNSRDRFSDEEVDFIRTVAGYVALADERVRVERERREMTAELDATIRAIAAPLIIYNAEGAIVRMNRAAEKVFPFAAERRRRPLAERGKEVWIETADGIPLPMEDWPVNRALRGETVAGEILRFHFPPSRAAWGSVSAAPISTPQGEINGAVATFVDITPLHDLQREREMYVHTISHDLRTPLTVILGHAQLLAAQYREEGVRLHVDAIVTGAERMKRMIEDLVEIARLEGGEIKLERVPVRLDLFLSELLQRSATALDPSRIVTEVPMLPSVAADPARLERIFTNLLTNALKFSSPETMVTVRARLNGETVVVSVHDRGLGIDPEDLPHIFERYYPLKGGKKADSVGLGLYITRSLVEAHGGQVCAESAPGVGSDFYFTLPLSVCLGTRE